MGMEIEVTSGAIATLLEEAARAAPAECCGMLFGQGSTIASVQPAANVHADPLRHFEIDPAALIAAHRAERGGGPALIGYYHSHPGGHPLPSATDCAHSSGDGRVWAIIAGGAVGFFRDTAAGSLLPIPHRVIAG
jgi:proteasome lid subunit RPN8/RPN11